MCIRPLRLAGEITFHEYRRFALANPQMLNFFVHLQEKIRLVVSEDGDAALRESSVASQEQSAGAASSGSSVAVGNPEHAGSSSDKV